MSEFGYITNKIKNAEWISHPFPHLEINNLLSEEHLNIILSDPQIHFDVPSDDDDELYRKLLSLHYKIQDFPGSINDWGKYKRYKQHNNYKSEKTPVEGVGITFRLHDVRNQVIVRLLTFMNGSEFHDALRKKFDIDRKTSLFTAIQKNLTKYELSPHPDVKHKCLTFLININRDDTVENYDCHTHLLELKDEYKCIAEYWENPNINRCWVSWDICHTVKKINKNNTLVVFKPESNPPTLHAVKLDYDHFRFQRTQFYGNMMYVDCPSYEPDDWYSCKKKLHLQ